MFTKAVTLLAALSAIAGAVPSSHIGRRHTHGHQQSRRDTITSDGIKIVNNLEKTVYLWSVSETSGPMETVKSGETWSDNWKTNPDGGGISIKLSFTEEQTDVLQYEYTLEEPTIWWDLSCINMGDNSEFSTMGFDVSSSDGSCESASCPAGDFACAAAYLFPDDNQATRSCQSQDLLVLTLGSSNATSA